MPTEIYKGFTLNQVGQPIWGAQENTNFKQLIDLLLNASGSVKYIAKDGSTVTTGTIQFAKGIEVSGVAVGDYAMVVPNNTKIISKGSSTTIGEGSGGAVSLTDDGVFVTNNDGHAFLSIARESSALVGRTSIIIKASDSVANWNGGIVHVTQLAANISVSANNTSNSVLGQLILNQSTMSMSHDGGIHALSDIRFAKNGTPALNKIPMGTDAFGNWTWQPVGDLTATKLDKVQSSAQSVASIVEWNGLQRFRNGFESYTGSDKTADLNRDGRFRCTGPIEMYDGVVGTQPDRFVIDGVGFGVIGNRRLSDDAFHTRIDFTHEDIVITKSIVAPELSKFKIDVGTVVIPLLNGAAPAIGDVLGAVDVDGRLRWQANTAMNNVLDTNTVNLDINANTLTADVKIASDIVIPGQMLHVSGNNGLFVSSEEVLTVVGEDAYHRGYTFVGTTGLGGVILPLIHNTSENCASIIEVMAVFTASPTVKVGSAIVSYNAFNSTIPGGSYVLSRTYEVLGDGFAEWDFIHGNGGGGNGSQFGIRTNDTGNRSYDVYIKVISSTEKLQFSNSLVILAASVLQIGGAASSVAKHTVTIQMSKPGSILANAVVSPPTDGSSWAGGNNQGYYTGTSKTYKLVSVNCNLLRYVTNGVGSITMRLSYITGIHTTPYSAGDGNTISTWTATIPNTSGADWYYHGFVNLININIPVGATVFLDVNNRTATNIDGLAALLNFEEV